MPAVISPMPSGTAPVEFQTPAEMEIAMASVKWAYKSAESDSEDRGAEMETLATLFVRLADLHWSDERVGVLVDAEGGD